MEENVKQKAANDILRMKTNAEAEAKRQIQKFVEIAELEVKYAAAKQKASLVQDVKVKELASAFAGELLIKINAAKKAANFERLRWSTSFALPTSKYTVSSNTNLDWGAGYGGNVVTNWLPDWWTRMVREGVTVQGESSTGTSSLPASVDLSFTDVDTTTGVTAITDPHTGDFKSKVIIGHHTAATALHTEGGDDW